jgi:predicted ATP-binding protein involved in virulence
MKLVDFSVSKLHGFLDFELSFNDDLTIIVGRNGSGKTSALNLISDLLRLEVRALRRVPFQRAVVRLFDETLGTVSVNAENSENSRAITLAIGDATATLPLDSPLDLYFAEPGSGRASVTSRDVNLVWTPNITRSVVFHTGAVDFQDWQRLSKQISEVIKLTFVRLDRTIVAVDPDGTERVEAPRAKAGKAPPADPIEEVLRVTTQKFGEYKRRVEEIKNAAFNQLLQLHFEPIDQVSPRTKSSQAQLKAKVQQLRRRVENSALFADSPTVQASTSKFFASFSQALFEEPASPQAKKKTGRRSVQEEYAQILLNLKEKQIEKLLEIFDREQEQAQRAYGPIKRYLDATMKFLKESGKQLDFDASLQLGFNVPTVAAEDASEAGKQRSLKELASGERQVIIVLTYLAFLAGEDSIFIVDEPELSLHLRWQGYLVEALNSLRPETCQIIVATHAPEIAGRAKSKIRLLRPSYLPTDTE